MTATMAFNLITNGFAWTKAAMHELRNQPMELMTDESRSPIYVQLAGRNMMVMTTGGEVIYIAPFTISEKLQRIRFTFPTGPKTFKNMILEYWVVRLQ